MGYAYIDITALSTMGIVLVPVVFYYAIILLALFGVPFLVTFIITHALMGFNLHETCEDHNNVNKLKTLAKCSNCEEYVNKHAKMCRHCGANFG